MSTEQDSMLRFVGSCAPAQFCDKIVIQVIFLKEVTAFLCVVECMTFAESSL
jgi:hypothetical protein